MAMFTISPHTRVVDPATPVHSPHHSVHSSASSRLSLRNLTLHEYRKQQNSPASQATPPGKTLRRKAAASGLKEIERVPSLSRTPLSAARVPPRPLHISQSVSMPHSFLQAPSLVTSVGSIVSAAALFLLEQYGIDRGAECPRCYLPGRPIVKLNTCTDAFAVYLPTTSTVASPPGARLDRRRDLSVTVCGAEHTAQLI
jgi:hypothetical protein